MLSLHVQQRPDTRTRAFSTSGETLLVMFRIIALPTAFAVFATLPATPVAAEPARLIAEQHYSQDGYEVDLYITQDAESGILEEATITDPDAGDVVDVWSDGETIAWHGTIDGEPVEGSMARIDFDPQATPICFTPVTAILCLGAAVLLFGSNCAGRNEGPCPGPTVPPTDVPGGGGGVPDEGGDGDGDSDGGKGSGGDED